MPTSYKAPVDDFVFLLHEVFAPAGDLTPEDTRGVLEQAARFLEEVWTPLDAVGDEQACTLVDGKVITPAGFKPAYDAYCQAGWNSVAVPAEQGGAGLTELIAQAVREFSSSANSSLSLYPGLTEGAHAVIQRNGDEWMKKYVVPPMVAGRWTGTMCLTEAHCGTDLRLMRSRVTAQPDGSYRLSGTKIFISGGDHDLADNVIHLVLAKMPDASGRYPDELGAVNLFLVAKNQVDPKTGAMGSFNGVSVGSVERKMGLKGSATCTLFFENCVAYRLGGATDKSGVAKRSSSGMAGMFEMMNFARLGTGLQAIASAQRAYAHVANYARERVAGRAADPAHRSGGPADPIVVHPDVRRLLLKQASFIEAARAMGVYVRMLLDEPDPARRSTSNAIGSLLTPVVKAYFSDRSFESANDAMQVMGGHGYIHDNGVEQLVRDARIFQLYEGANGVQALDLVLRKLPAGSGHAFNEYIETVIRTAAEAGQHEELHGFAQGLLTAAKEVKACGEWFADEKRTPYDAGASSNDFLTMMGILSCGFMWLLMAGAAARKSSGVSNSSFHARKLALARYWYAREMPLIPALSQRVQSGSACLMELAAADF